MQADLILFWVFAPISVASAIAMLVMRNAVHSALFLIVNFFCLAVFFLMLGARSCSSCRSSCTRARSWCCSCS